MKTPWLKPQDVLTVLKLFSIGKAEWSFKTLSVLIGLSASELHNSIGRLKQAGLLYEKDRTLKIASQRLFYFIVHGVPAFYYPQRGQVCKGIPTAIFAPPVIERISPAGDDIPIVWPAIDGKARGESLLPIYDRIPAAVLVDSYLYELLALIDVIRVGRSKEKKAAVDILEKRFSSEEK